MARIRRGPAGALPLAGAALAAAAWASDLPPASPDAPAAPVALAAAPDGRAVYAACAGSRRILSVDPVTGRLLRAIPLPATPTGLAITPDGARLYATCADPDGRVCVIGTGAGTVSAVHPAGHGATAPLLAPDGKTLFVCNRFAGTVSALDVATGAERWCAPAGREPVAAAVTPDGAGLLVAGHLPDGRADTDHVAATLHILETATGRTAGAIALPDGSTELRAVALSPDGSLAAVTHILGRYRLPTTTVDRGWMNTNALTMVDVPGRKRVNTILLDLPDRGAANPWAAAWSPDGKTLAVSIAGTHEAALIDADALRAKLGARPDADASSDLGFLAGVGRRVPCGGQGPRALAFAGNRLFVANHFDDALAVLDPAGAPVRIPLGPEIPPDPARRGERLFNDATIAFQGWQSCASCHSDDGRVDGLNWDLMNDGLGTPKNTKSLVFSHETPPAMWKGIRDSSATAVRAGIRHILFAVLPDDETEALDAYVRSLKPLPSPHLVAGKPSEAARRGERIFNDPATGCAHCHPPGLYANLKSHDVGTRGPLDAPRDRFDTPSLIEAWRTAPYLHDGSSATLLDVLTVRNRADRHGKTSHLSKEQLDDLVAFLLSL
jgi:YVTN family beta-propeller protein